MVGDVESDRADDNGVYNAVTGSMTMRIGALTFLGCSLARNWRAV